MAISSPLSRHLKTQKLKKSLRVNQALSEATRVLRKTTQVSFLEAELLLTEATGKSKEELLARDNDFLLNKEVGIFKRLLSKRLKGKPIAYLLGKKEFYGLKLEVFPSVFIPRPETELIVEEAIRTINSKQLIVDRKVEIIEVGTGSGAIAIALADYCKKKNINCRIEAVDISREALKVARRNIQTHNLADLISLSYSQILKNIRTKADLIVANLPYLKTQEMGGLPDPTIALDGGKDGLQLIKKLLRQAPKFLKNEGAIILEIGFDQAKPLKKLVQKFLPHSQITIKKDLAGLDRIAIIRT